MDVLLPGIMPRSEGLVRATRDFERGRIGRPELAEARRADVLALKRLQDGLPHASPGLLAWGDLLRPFAEIIPGCAVDGLARFFETNSFWRTLEFPPDAAVDASRLDAWVERYFLADGLFDKEEGLVFTLPFPCVFRDYSRGLGLPRIAEILLAAAEPLVKLPNKVLCLFEPGFGYRGFSDEDRRIGADFIARLKTLSPTPVYLVSAFFPMGDDLEYFFGLPADGFGVDLYANPLDDVLGRLPVGKALLAGVLSTGSTLVESPDVLRGVLERLRAGLPDDKIHLTPSGPAELLPRTVLEAKVTNLREILG
jgi:methionine synthase II (cobalamin-independent)